MTLSIGIIRSTSIGDVVLATACLNLLQKLQISSSVHWIGRDPTLSLLKKCYPSINIYELNSPAPKATLNTLDLILDLQCTPRSKLLCRRLKPPSFSPSKTYLQRRRLILESRIFGRKRPMSTRVSQQEFFQFELMVNALREALCKLLPPENHKTIRCTSARPSLPIKHLPCIQGKPDKYIVVSAGSSFETKRCPAPIMAKILRNYKSKLMGTCPDLIFVGSEDDILETEHVLDEIIWPGTVQNLCGQTSLDQTAQWLSEAQFVLCNDSAITHLAEAVQTPALTLFGPTAENFGFAPHLPKSQPYSVNLGCRPCSKHGKYPCRYGDKMCFNELPLGDIVEKMIKTTSL